MSPLSLLFSTAGGAGRAVSAMSLSRIPPGNNLASLTTALPQLRLFFTPQSSLLALLPRYHGLWLPARDVPGASGTATLVLPGEQSRTVCPCPSLLLIPSILPQSVLQLWAGSGLEKAGQGRSEIISGFHPHIWRCPVPEDSTGMGWLPVHRAPSSQCVLGRAARTELPLHTLADAPGETEGTNNS